MLRLALALRALVLRLALALRALVLRAELLDGFADGRSVSICRCLLCLGVRRERSGVLLRGLCLLDIVSLLAALELLGDSLEFRLLIGDVGTAARFFAFVLDVLDNDLFIELLLDGCYRWLLRLRGRILGGGALSGCGLIEWRGVERRIFERRSLERLSLERCSFERHRTCGCTGLGLSTRGGLVEGRGRELSLGTSSNLGHDRLSLGARGGLVKLRWHLDGLRVVRRLRWGCLPGLSAALLELPGGLLASRGLVEGDLRGRRRQRRFKRQLCLGRTLGEYVTQRGILIELVSARRGLSAQLAQPALSGGHGCLSLVRRGA